jgi:hypothetical protein
MSPTASKKPAQSNVGRKKAGSKGGGKRPHGRVKAPPLTPQQEAFAVLVAKGKCTATDAAIRCGYSAKSADSIAAQLKANPKVANRIKDIQGKAARRAEQSVAGVLEMLGDTHERAMEIDDLSAANKATELLGKQLGMFVNKVEVDVELSLADMINAARAKIDEK